MSQVTGLTNVMLQSLRDAIDRTGKQFLFSGGAGMPTLAGDAAPQPIRHHATGGPVRAGEIAVVGERGPELVRFGGAGYVTPNDMLAPSFSSAMPGIFRALVSGLHDLANVLRKQVQAGANLAAGGYAAAARAMPGIGASVPFRGGPAGTFSGAGQAHADSWMTFLMSSMGLPKWKAAEVTAGLEGESGVNLRPDQEYWDVNGMSGGTAAWHNDRLAGLKKFAADMGRSWQDVKVQQQWFKHEMETTHKGAWGAITAAHKPGQALSAFVRGYEVPANADGEIAKRSGYVSRLMQGSFSTTLARHLDAIEARQRQQEVALKGRGEVRVTIAQDGRLKGVQTRSQGHIQTNVGVDKTGARMFRPLPAMPVPA
jgi:hypothetical protein